MKPTKSCWAFKLDIAGRIKVVGLVQPMTIKQATKSVMQAIADDAEVPSGTYLARVHDGPLSAVKVAEVELIKK